MIVQMKMRKGNDSFSSLSDTWSNLDLSGLNLFDMYILIELLNKYVVLVGCDGESCMHTRLSVIDYLKSNTVSPRIR